MSSTNSSKPTAIVIGAGVGGISTAARLAHAGYEVQVFEKNEFAGGRCSLIHHEGYRFDQGPSLLLLPPLFHQLYNDLGEKLEDHIELIQCNPNYIIHYHDGEKVILSSDRAKMAEEAEKWDGPGGAARLEGFLAEARKHGEVSYDQVLGKNFPSIFSILRPNFVRHVLDLHPFATVYGRCARWFKTERMRRAFSFASMYLGSSPFDAPGTYSLLQWSETCEGIWYPKGGFYQVPASLKRIAEKNGAQFHMSTPVKCVTYDNNNKATGIILGNGEKKTADVVVVNADLTWAYNNLFVKEGSISEGKANGDANAPKGKKELLSPRKAQSLVNKPHSCSSISFYWAMDRKFSELTAHNIFLAEEYKASFDDIFRDRSMPREPSFYINVPSRLDPTAAPEGKDSLVVLVPVGHLSPGKKGSDPDDEGKDQDWPALVERARKQIIDIVEERLKITGLKDMITWEEVNTPLTWREKFNLTHGSILGITHDFWNVLAFRHQSRHPKLKDAYFVGASAHPGTGVPIAIAGSKLCAETILRDHNMPLPATYSREVARITSDLDRPRSQNLVHVFERTALASAPYVAGALLATTLISLGLLITGLITLPSVLRLVPTLSKFLHTATNGTIGAIDQVEGKDQFWNTYVPKSTNGTSLFEKYGWTLPVIALNLVMAYMTLFGAKKAVQPAVQGQRTEKVTVPVVAREKVVVPVPVAVNAVPLGRQL